MCHGFTTHSFTDFKQKMAISKMDKKLSPDLTFIVLIHFHMFGTKVDVIICILKVKCPGDQNSRIHHGSL